MTLSDYQHLAMRTANPDLTNDQRLQHALFGLASEAGEIMGIYQKSYQGHPIVAAKVHDEIGDVLWMVAELCTALDVDMGAVAQMNINKLRARYPTGFSAERSIHREE